MIKKTYDFSKVEILDIEGNKEIADASKVIGNTVYKSTSDIGIMDLAREIYHTGKAALSREEANYFKNAIINSNELIAPLKVAINDFFKE